MLDIPPQSPTVDDLGAYVEWLVQDGLSPATIKNHMSAIKNLYLYWDIPKVTQIFESFSWSLTLRALKYASRVTFDNRTAITTAHLLALVRVCSGDTALLPLKIVLIFGFIGYLRISNLAQNTFNDIDVTRNTTWGDIWPSEDGIIFSLKWSKTRQCNINRVSIPMPALGQSELFPLRAWREYSTKLVGVNVSQDSPLLMSTVHPVGRPITVSIVRAFLRRDAEAAGLSSFAYTPHSLHRGGASCSFNLGVPLEHIKHHGTWESDSVNSYLFRNSSFNTPVARAFASHLANTDI